MGGPGAGQAEVHIPAPPCVWFVTSGKALNPTQALALPLCEVGPSSLPRSVLGGLNDVMR